MADAPQPDSEKKDADKKMRERVDKLVAQAGRRKHAARSGSAARRSTTPSTPPSCRSSPKASRARSASRRRR